MIYKERLRFGTIELFRKLQSEGIESWIYTTSFRTDLKMQFGDQINPDATDVDMKKWLLACRTG